MLHSTPDETEMERIKEEAETGQLQRALESALAEGEAKGMAEGEAKGKAKVRGIPPSSLSISLGRLGAPSQPPHRAHGAHAPLSPVPPLSGRLNRAALRRSSTR